MATVNGPFEGIGDTCDDLASQREHSTPAFDSLGNQWVSCAECKLSIDGLECRSDGNVTAPHTIPGSQPEEQVKKDAGDPVRSIIRAKEVDVSNKDGVAGSGFGNKLVCEGGKGRTHREDGIVVEATTGGVKNGKVACEDRVSGPGVRGEELGVEKTTSDASFRLS